MGNVRGLLVLGAVITGIVAAPLGFNAHIAGLRADHVTSREAAGTLADSLGLATTSTGLRDHQAQQREAEKARERTWIAVGLAAAFAVGAAIAPSSSAARAVSTSRLNSSAAATEGSSEVDQAPRRPCPHCAELILPAAQLCRFCGHPVEEENHSP